VVRGGCGGGFAGVQGFGEADEGDEEGSQLDVTLVMLVDGFKRGKEVTNRNVEALLPAKVLSYVSSDQWC
jgi:hypothetical protein